MEKAPKNGQMELHIWEIMNSERKKERENLLGVIMLLMKGIFIIIILKGKVNIYGQMAGNILEVGKIIRCMVMGNFFGQMVNNT